MAENPYLCEVCGLDNGAKEPNEDQLDTCEECTHESWGVIIKRRVEAAVAAERERLMAETPHQVIDASGKVHARFASADDARGWTETMSFTAARRRIITAPVCRTCGKPNCTPQNHAGWSPDDEGYG